MFDCLLPELLYLDGQQLGIADSEVKNRCSRYCCARRGRSFFFFSVSFNPRPPPLEVCNFFFSRYMYIHVGERAKRARHYQG